MTWCLNEQCASVLAKNSTDGYCPPCRKMTNDGYRSGLLRAARRASAMAGTKLHIACPRPNADCAHCALLSLAKSLREEAGK